MARYLVTSSARKVGGLFLLDSATGATRKLLEGSYRGLTRGPDGGYYVVSGSRSQQAPHAAIYRVDPGSGESELLAEHAIGDSHDLRWIDGHFYLVASLGNQIVRLDERCRMIDRMQIVEDDRDVCHVNCLSRMDGELYCSIFTLSPGERKDKRLTGAWHTEGKVLKLDYGAREFEIAYEPLGQPHSLVPGDGALYLVESFHSRVTRVDLARRQANVLRAYTGFVRGLEFGPGEALLGVSLLDRKDRRILKPLSPVGRLLERVQRFAGVLVVDPKTWRVRRRIPLPGTEVYEILCLGEA
jgi:hypothetical protein